MTRTITCPALLLALLLTACPGAGTTPLDTDDPESSTGANDGTSATTEAPTSTSVTSEPTISSEPGTTTGDASTSVDPPTCGDGQVDPGEECDDGENNADYGPCTTACTNARCGDGFVYQGIETCDDGPLNGTEESTCSARCQTLAHCGDGERDPATEECDAGPDNGAGFCTDTCSLHGLVVFVTSTSHDGDLRAYDPKGASGIAGADAICQARALEGALHDASSFVAWISVDEVSAPASRYPAAAMAGLPFVLPGDGTWVAADWAGLTGGALLHAIDRTETGTDLSGVKVWTNTKVTGELDSPTLHCEGWSSANPELFGRDGWNGATGALWTEMELFKCKDTGHHLYCVEVPVEME